MKVIICCEGLNDVGPLTNFVKKSAFLESLEVECEIHKSIANRIKLYKKRDTREIMIYKLYVLAKLKDCKHIGYHQDADNNEFLFVYNAIKNDFINNVPNTIKCLPIVPQKTMESWLLSDESAYPNKPKNPSLPINPEDIWGSPRDPGSNHPKKYFIHVLAQFGIVPNRNTYSQIAENTDIEVLKRRCPKSFGQFYEDMQVFIGEGSTP